MSITNEHESLLKLCKNSPSAATDCKWLSKIGVAFHETPQYKFQNENYWQFGITSGDGDIVGMLPKLECGSLLIYWKGAALIKRDWTRVDFLRFLLLAKAHPPFENRWHKVDHRQPC